MKISVHTKTGRVSSCMAIVAGALLFYGCATRQAEPTSPVESYNINRPPVEAPESAKVNDFRLNPPVVEDITIKKLNGGKVLLAVHFAADQRLGRTVTISPGEDAIVLHDDGLKGDEKGGDNVYSAILTSDWDSLAAEQNMLLAELIKRHALTVPVFSGRGVTGVKKIIPDEQAGAQAGGSIKILPFGSGAPMVIPNESLFITDTNVVDDTLRTFDPCTGAGTPMGKWTFGYLMTQMANTPVTGVDPSDFVLNWLQTWETSQPVNGFTVPARTAITTLINNWPTNGNGKLDLSQAPMKLSAIVNRIDLAANSAYGPVSGAEGRFVFTVMGGGGTNSSGFGGGTNSSGFGGTNASGSGGCSPELFTVIVEYGVPATNCETIQSWAQQWLNLQDFTLGSTQYNAALEAITDQFTAANANPAKPNGSALDQLRTDEIQLGLQQGLPWELREFQIGTNQQLNEVTVKQTPEKEENPPGPMCYYQNGTNNAALVQWINQNQTEVTNNTYTVPDDLTNPPGGPFLGGSAPNNIDFWNATPNTTSINLEAARHQFSLNTCNGCHGAETGTDFRHVQQNSTGEAGLSGFLTGITNTVPLNLSTQTIPPNSANPVYIYDDLERRAQILSEDASASCPSAILFGGQGPNLGGPIVRHVPTLYRIPVTLSAD
jgi:hypothetical protein